MNKTQLVATLYEMRSNPRYQAAEAMRRKSSAAAMANAEKNTDEYGAITLLVNTWETISVLVLAIENAENRELIFETTPVFYMFTELNDAIEKISEEFPYFAANFRLLSKLQFEWLKFKDDRYQTGEKGGMHALFG